MSLFAQTNTSRLTSDIIKMTKNGVSNDVIIVYIQNQSNPIIQTVTNRFQIIDMESYEFFQRFYLYPRTLRYQRENVVINKKFFRHHY